GGQPAKRHGPDVCCATETMKSAHSILRKCADWPCAIPGKNGFGVYSGLSCKHDFLPSSDNFRVGHKIRPVTGFGSHL
ncbi:hypothetical protein SB816_32675, partial [Achromobacter sp. SIMBA_011]|uniref:hypothetical protein n=1 Tax=Achromobacter sp. SIMBA_011 TaxID=3085759 RepID=UPI00397CF595